MEYWNLKEVRQSTPMQGRIERKEEGMEAHNVARRITELVIQKHD